MGASVLTENVLLLFALPKWDFPEVVCAEGRGAAGPRWVRSSKAPRLNADEH